MNWQDIKISCDNKSFLNRGTILFGKSFVYALKFHTPGLAAVQDESGCYHINVKGDELYRERYTRTFGYYCNRAAVADKKACFHINEIGVKAYENVYEWTGNYQENLCPVRNDNKEYFHIDLYGQRISSTKFIYAGDFKDGISCVKTKSGFYKHMDSQGNFINEKEFLDLDVFHKNFAAAKDEIGWYHIDKNGCELYPQRYLNIEPFYNGFAIVAKTNNNKEIINEQGKTILEI